MKKISLFAIVIFASMAAMAQKSKVDTSQVYTTVDEIPKFPGGNDEFMKYLNEKISTTSRKEKKSGLVVIVSIVEKDGTFSNCKAMKSLDTESDSIAVSLLIHAPRWIPAIKNGQPVRCKYAIPIRFGSPSSIEMIRVKEPKN